MGKFKNRRLVLVNNEATTGATYGKLYNWYALVGNLE
jgi:hypothetical protein